MKTKSLVLAKPNQRKRSKHPNRTVNSQAFVKTTIKKLIVISRYFSMIYQALKLPYHPALLTRAIHTLWVECHF